MLLTPGAKLGPYEILSSLGAGGMGEVYRARDPRLGRVVAIKVLPADRIADEYRRGRFVQEARAASALNHPSIVTIHQIDSVDGIDFIVMEYVSGKTLDLVIPQQGMKIEQILKVAIPIADALASAHAAGIVHRDLKPANVMVSDEGAVKVLDFGLAKLVAPKGVNPNSETATEHGAGGPLSRPGTAAGTLGYMSPEQASGRKVDSRSDVFSFGAVLYEMVTGRRAFSGDSSAATLAAILRDQPTAPTEIVPGVPWELERLIERCLRKEVERRFQHMLDVKLELEQIKEDSSSGQTGAAPARARRTRRWLIIAAALVLVVPVVAWRLLRPRDVPLSPPRLVPLTTFRQWTWRPTFSPDGNQVAFAWNGEKGDNIDIYVKMIGSSQVLRLTTDPEADLSPSWSPDGRQIAFVHIPPGTVPNAIHLVSPLGGPGRKVADLPVWGNGQLSWSPDGRWLAATRDFWGGESAAEGAGGIYLIPLLGGEPRRITRPSPGVDEAPAFSPDGRRLAYVSCDTPLPLAPCDVHVVEMGPDFVPKGPPRRLTRQRFFEPGGLTWARDGATIIYAAGQGPYTSYLWRVGVDGERPPERIEMAGHGAGSPAISRSGYRLAFSSSLYDQDIYRFRAGHPSEPFLSSSFYDGDAVFSPDGRRVAFGSFRSGETMEIWLAGADGSNPQQLTHGPGRWQGPTSWSPDARQIAFDSMDEDGHVDIWVMEVDGSTPRHLTQGVGDKGGASWSRDGRWVYFSCKRNNASEIWRVPATGGAEEQVTHGGASGRALESLDGQTLLFRRKAFVNSPLIALPLAGGPERTLVDCVAGGSSFAVGASGVVYPGCENEPALHLLDPASGKDRILGKLEKLRGPLTVSPDGQTILYPKIVSDGGDLMLIDNFR